MAKSKFIKIKFGTKIRLISIDHIVDVEYSPKEIVWVKTTKDMISIKGDQADVFYKKFINIVDIGKR